ncbi:MAG TPA: hypothetical protein VGI55_05975 [Solirubrobacteraceae bacterium]|jgi:hypothetical protein
MAKSRQDLRARVTRVPGRRRKKPTSRVERASDKVKQLVRETGDRVFGAAGERADEANKSSAKKTAAERKRRGKQRQAEAKKAGAGRIRRGKQRQAGLKKAARKRRIKTS